PQATDHEHPDIRRKRLLFRCWHRGTQESDLILGPFAEDSLTTLNNDQLGRFEALLDCTDPDLFDWIFGVRAALRGGPGTTQCPAGPDGTVGAILRAEGIAGMSDTDGYWAEESTGSYDFDNDGVPEAYE